MKKYVICLLIFVYGLGAAVAYGHAYINNARTFETFDGGRREYDSLARGFIALWAAAFWPLYGSVVYWEAEHHD